MTTFETGATSHAVNELILFTDNTRELAELRDRIYVKMKEDNTSSYNPFNFERLLTMSSHQYRREIGDIRMTDNEKMEYLFIYSDRFVDWKQENGY